MLGGAHRFSEIRAAVPGLSERLLAERLREFVTEGLASRDVVDGQPVEVHYTLTDQGVDLAPVVRSVLEWAHRWQPDGH